MANEMFEIMTRQVTAQMPRDELEQHIVEFIKEEGKA